MNAKLTPTRKPGRPMASRTANAVGRPIDVDAATEDLKRARAGLAAAERKLLTGLNRQLQPLGLEVRSRQAGSRRRRKVA